MHAVLTTFNAIFGYVCKKWVKMGLCVSVCVHAGLRMGGLCKPLPADNLDIVCVCASPYHIHTVHILRVWCMKWKVTDTYLLWAGLRSLSAGLAWPSSSPAVFLCHPPSLTQAFTHKPWEDLLHAGTTDGLLAPKQSEAAQSDILIQGNSLLSLL